MALTHIRDATPLPVLLQRPHIRDATPLHVLLQLPHIRDATPLRHSSSNCLDSTSGLLKMEKLNPQVRRPLFSSQNWRFAMAKRSFSNKYADGENSAGMFMYIYIYKIIINKCLTITTTTKIMTIIIITIIIQIITIFLFKKKHVSKQQYYIYIYIKSDLNRYSLI